MEEKDYEKNEVSSEGNYSPEEITYTSEDVVGYCIPDHFDVFDIPDSYMEGETNGNY